MPNPSPQQKTQQKPQQSRTRRKPKSRYGTQLAEKQNLKNIFTIREGQLKKYYEAAHNKDEETGPYIIKILESRLDNAIYRAGFATTRAQARQMATHRLFTVNGRPVDVPSVLLKENDVVAVKENKRGKAYFENFDKKMQNVRTPEWVLVDPSSLSFKVVGAPNMEEANLGVDIKAVVELFAR